MKVPNHCSFHLSPERRFPIPVIMPVGGPQGPSQNSGPRLASATENGMIKVKGKKKGLFFTRARDRLWARVLGFPLGSGFRFSQS